MSLLRGENREKYAPLAFNERRPQRAPLDLFIRLEQTGEVAEWFNAHAWKA